MPRPQVSPLDAHDRFAWTHAHDDNFILVPPPDTLPSLTEAQEQYCGDYCDMHTILVVRLSKTRGTVGQMNSRLDG